MAKADEAHNVTGATEADKPEAVDEAAKSKANEANEAMANEADKAIVSDVTIEADAADEAHVANEAD